MRRTGQKPSLGIEPGLLAQLGRVSGSATCASMPK